MNTNPQSSAPRTAAPQFGKPDGGWRLRLYTIIFEADTVAGRRFDVSLIVAILVSVLVVLLDGVQTIGDRFNAALHALEWAFTLLFTAEYAIRVGCVRYPLRYATSFFGVIDLLSFLPTYLGFFIPEIHSLLDVRILRLIFKLDDTPTLRRGIRSREAMSAA